MRRKVCGELRLEERPNFSIRSVPYGVFSARGQLLLPRLLRAERVDLFHSTNFMAPLTGFRGKLIVTIHDIIPLKFPEYAPRSKKTRLFFIYKALMNWIVTVSDAIIADSENSRSDILEFFGIPPSKVHTIYLGVDPGYRPLPAEKREEVRRALGVKDRLALYAGRADPYKNLISLIKAAESINAAGDTHCTVVVAGEKDPRYPEVENHIVSAGIRDDVIFAGSMDEDRLIPLYNAADVLVLPSLYEGFGLPPLEAMACGTPVICSDRASIPEVVGKAGILVDPMDVHAISEAMERVFKDAGLRERMREDGLKRAALFPWKKTAERTLELYRELYRTSDYSATKTRRHK